jgi:hypothetical protein
MGKNSKPNNSAEMPWHEALKLLAGIIANRHLKICREKKLAIGSTSSREPEQTKNRGGSETGEVR